jgi:glutathione reductase (NADPH)
MKKNIASRTRNSGRKKADGVGSIVDGPLKHKHYELLVIGAGSGGLALINHAYEFGVHAAIVESSKIGGVCTSTGGVPTKLMIHLGEAIRDAKDVASKGAMTLPGGVEFDWGYIKKIRDQYLLDLQTQSTDLLNKEKFDIISGYARFLSPKELKVNDQIYTADNIVIATGSRCRSDLRTPGAELCKDPWQIFECTKKPDSILIIGSGYVAMETAGMTHNFGVEVYVSVRSDRVLKMFDRELTEKLMESMEKDGINFLNNTCPTKFELVDPSKPDGKKRAHFKCGNTLEVDDIYMAIGRVPNTDNIDIENAGVRLGKKGEIITDEYFNTSTPGITAIGDVLCRVTLTPVAIREGKILAERLFNRQHTLKMDYNFIPSVVFTHPAIGSVGLTEDEAIEKYGHDEIRVYTTTFDNIYYAFTDKKCYSPSFMKIITILHADNAVGEWKDKYARKKTI